MFVLYKIWIFFSILILLDNIILFCKEFILFLLLIRVLNIDWIFFFFRCLIWKIGNFLLINIELEFIWYLIFLNFKMFLGLFLVNNVLVFLMMFIIFFFFNVFLFVIFRLFFLIWVSCFLSLFLVFFMVL